ncbi:hypothetical protein GCM10010277_28860 [Streptomyces longisporoflavus]|nr:hypothetical protein GCM10010277_28860 [Streptomyces longisporoflavus]
MQKSTSGCPPSGAALFSAEYEGVCAVDARKRAVTLPASAMGGLRRGEVVSAVHTYAGAHMLNQRGARGV